MTTDRCDRLWQVELLEDGRLEPKDRASFERHVPTCAACSLELLRLRELGQVMSEAPSAERTDLERRRARIGLLSAANQRVLERHAPSRKLRIWALAAAVPLLALSGAALAHYSSARAATSFEVVSVAQADWSANKSGTTSRITLRAGVASFHVEHVASGARFLVVLPDGEIEVRGTRFIVDVAGGQTRSVRVSEGVVALRVGGAEHVLHASERWQKVVETVSPPPAPTPAAPSLEHAVPVPMPNQGAFSPTHSRSAQPNINVPAAPIANDSRPTPPRVASLASKAPSAVAAVAPTGDADEPTVGAAPTVSPIGPGARFAEAVAAFSAGDYGRADTLFGAFARDFSTDSRAEDAMFLRADARARRGDKAGAAAGARAYLRAYPNGLRRPAAERLAGGH